MLPQFDRGRLIIKPLKQRVHDLSLTSLLYPEELPPPLPDRAMDDLAELGRRMVQARERGASVIMLMGAHVLRAGVQRQLIDLMQRGLITHVGMNGAGPIHDYEMARIGATCESVARYIRSGEFGLWRETGEINDIVREGAAAGLGLGEAIGKAIEESDFPHKEISVLAAGYRLGVPVTVHVGIGYDIIHEHPNFDPAAFGTASYRDFLAVCDTVSRLEGGVFLCFGSAVMGPEVYLKALSMARNVAHQEGRKIATFTTAAFDLIPIQGEWHEEAPKSNPQYYYRPWKTILVRTVADGGESFYVCGDHRQTLPYLRQSALKAAGGKTASKRAAGESKPAEQASETASQAAMQSDSKPAATKASPSKPSPKPSAHKPATTKGTTPAEPPPLPMTQTVPMRELLPKRNANSASPASAARSPAMSEDLDGAVAQYQQLKEWVRSKDATDLEWYESPDKETWHHTTITKEKFLRLFYRIVWTAGFKSRVVVSKEEDFFRVVNEVLYPKGQFQPRRQAEFLMKVAAILGGSADNRKNKSIVQVMDLIETSGWDEFRGQYLTPQTGLHARLQKLPMIGPKGAKLLLHQLGISDSGKEDVQVTRFAAEHGFADAHACIRALAARTGDAATTISFVIWDGGRKEGAPAKD